MNKLSAIARKCFTYQFHPKTDTLVRLALQLGVNGGAKVLAEANHLAGNFHQSNFNSELAEKYYLKAIDLSTSDFDRAKYQLPLGGVFKLKGDIPKAIENFLNVKKTLENLEGKLEEEDESVRRNIYTAVLNSLANTHNAIEDYESANEYYRLAYNYSLELEQIRNASIILSNKGEMLYNTGAYSDAIVDLELADSLKKEVGLSEISINNTQYTIALCYDAMGKTSLAFSLYQKVIDKYVELEYYPRLSMAYSSLGKLQTKLKEYKPALANCLKGLELIKEHKNLEFELTTYECLHQVYKEIGQYEKSLNMYEQYILLRDSLRNEKNIKLTTQLEMQHVFDKEQEKREILDREKKTRNAIIISALAGIAFSLFLMSYLIYRRLQLKRKSEKILAEKNQIISTSLKEKDVLLREIHHRVKNNLQVVSSLLSLQTKYINDPQIALAVKSGKDRVKAMSLIHQNLYQRENLTGIHVDEYFDKLISSLFNSYNIAPGKIKLIKDIEKLNLDVDTVVPLGLISNELITNALKYAFPNDASGEIKVSLKEVDGLLCLKVEDNGVGMDPGLHTEGDGFGFELIDAFKEKLDASMELKSENGTAIEIAIKKYKRA